MRRWQVLAATILIALAIGGCGESDRTEVIAEGLVSPIGLTVLDDGRILVAEAGTGEDDTSAGVSLVANGRVDRVVSGLPSGRDSGDLSGSPMVGVSPDGTTIFTSYFNAEALLTFQTPTSESIASGVALSPGDLDMDMRPEGRVALVNAFDITFTPEGDPVVTDASENGVAIRTEEGTTRFLHRFGELKAPDDEALRVEAVPTGITRIGDEYYVTLTGGCPYPEDVGRLVAIDGERGERDVVTGLNMPIDVIEDEDGNIWLLEFARFEEGASCFSGEGYLSGTGRLSRVEGNEVVPVIERLDYPGSVAMGPDGSIYVTEVFSGRIVRVDVGEEVEAARPTSQTPARPWRFQNVAGEEGLAFRHGAFADQLSQDHVAEMGGGLCWLDHDDDGRLDLYLVNSHALADSDHWDQLDGLPTNGLYRNTEDGFEDITEESGTGLGHRGMGCVAADFDGDGDSDIYVTADGPNALLINDGDGRFTETAVEAGVATEGWSSVASVADVDGDDDLDLFVGSFIDLDRKVSNPSGAFPQDYLGLRNHLYLNDGTGEFEEVAKEVGLVEEERTLGAVFTDVDADGRVDLYVANDGHPNRLHLNISDGSGLRFVDETERAGVGDARSGMGVASGDYDQDGAMDLFVTNWDDEIHTLYRNEVTGGEPSFTNATFRIGVSGFGRGETGWGTTWGDFDHDTDLDLIIANGKVPITNLDEDRESLRLMGNLLSEGSPGQMRDWTKRVQLDDSGRLHARGSAVADYDNDGDLDLAVNQIAGPASLLENTGAPGDWLGVDVEPATPGTVVTVTLDDGRVLERELHTGSSYLASEDPRAHFGLGRGNTIREVVIRWPDGAEERLEEVAPNQYIEVGRP